MVYKSFRKQPYVLCVQYYLNLLQHPYKYVLLYAYGTVILYLPRVMMSFTDIKLNIIYRNMRGIWSSWHRFNGLHAYSREYHYQHSVHIRFYSSYPIKLRVTENYFQWFSLFISILRCMPSYLVLLYLSISQDENIKPWYVLHVMNQTYECHHSSNVPHNGAKYNISR